MVVKGDQRPSTNYLSSRPGSKVPFGAIKDHNDVRAVFNQIKNSGNMNGKDGLRSLMKSQEQKKRPNYNQLS